MEKHENLDVTENFFQVDEKRQAMQKYKQYNIPEEDLEASEAARLAPSTEKSQPWHFIIVKDPKKSFLQDFSKLSCVRALRK